MTRRVTRETRVSIRKKQRAPKLKLYSPSAPRGPGRIGKMSLFRQLKKAAFGPGRQNVQRKARLALPEVPFYELDPLPWWSRKGWTYFFVTADTMITYVSRIRVLKRQGRWS